MLPRGGGPHGPHRRLSKPPDTTATAVLLLVMAMVAVPQLVGEAKALRLSPPFSSGRAFVLTQAQTAVGNGSSLSVLTPPHVNLTSGQVFFAENASISGAPNTSQAASFSGWIGFSWLRFTASAAGGPQIVNVSWRISARIDLYSKAPYPSGGLWDSGARLILQSSVKYAANGSTAAHISKLIFHRYLTDQSFHGTRFYSNMTESLVFNVPPHQGGTGMELRTWIFYRVETSDTGYCSTACPSIWAAIAMGAPILPTRLLVATVA
jgi:hypothetical protein